MPFGPPVNKSKKTKRVTHSVRGVSFSLTRGGYGIRFRPMAPTSQIVGQTISHYRVIEKVGGGMGVVYKAEEVAWA